MSWQSGTSTSYLDLADKLDTFLKIGHALPISWTGTGTGTLQNLAGTSTTVQETITVTWSSATAFSVSGSVTGAMGSGTVGTTFSHSKLTFKAANFLPDGVTASTAWANGDTATFVMTPPWTQIYTAGTGGERTYIWQAPGNGGADQILVGLQTFSNPGTGYYNWRLQGFTGTSSPSAATFNSQPGAVPTSPTLPLWNGSIPYTFVADGKHVKVIANVSTLQEFAYLGFLDSYCSPGEYPYPLAVVGSMSYYTDPAAGDSSWKYSWPGVEHAAGPMSAAPFYAGSDAAFPVRVRNPAARWVGFSRNLSNYQGRGMIWPDVNTNYSVQPNIDGGYDVLPFQLLEVDNADVIHNIYGELNGIGKVTGQGQGAGNTISIGRDAWMVVQNVFRTTVDDYMAVRLG